ncbi:MAG: CDGSH iron-sulfur domain-containing protein [Chloroflexi bacterium]|nr:CDGSH iron-sulfur domain-containing protein [Chloroflexota bacterium]
MTQTTITPLVNGPYLVKGPIKLVDVGGNEFEVKGEAIALCRCGGSKNKPFCDGTHKKVNFQAETRAPAKTTGGVG